MKLILMTSATRQKVLYVIGRGRHDHAHKSNSLEDDYRHAVKRPVYIEYSSKGTVWERDISQRLKQEEEDNVYLSKLADA